jgi:hypothetical protein
MKRDALIFMTVLEEFGIRRVRRLFAALHTSSLMVDDPRVLVAFGLRGVKRGDRVKVVNLGRGKWRVEHLSTGNSVTRNVREILGARKRSMFGPKR